MSVLFGAHKLNEDGGHDLVREEVGEEFAQMCETSLQRVPEAVRAEREGEHPDMSSLVGLGGTRARSGREPVMKASHDGQSSSEPIPLVLSSSLLLCDWPFSFSCSR